MPTSSAEAISRIKKNEPQLGLIQSACLNNLSQPLPSKSVTYYE
ncbi:hypothetical protein [Rubritalea tangerina]